MKETMKSVVAYCYKNTHYRVFTGVFLLALVASGAATVYLFMPKESAANSAAMEMSSQETQSANIGIVGEESATSTGNIGPNNSWPGELVSSDIAQVQPQREGVITEWRVRVGQSVSAGQILAKVSAPPNTPELIKMLAEQTESVARARAQAKVTNEFTQKEQVRLLALRDAIGNSSNVTAGADLQFAAIQSLRSAAEAKKQALRSFVERTLNTHVSLITNYSDWRNVRWGAVGQQYGAINADVHNSYEMALLVLADALESSADLPIDTASKYFALAVRLGNNTVEDSVGFEVAAAADQKEFLDMVGEYRDAQTMVADKETEYKLMVNEKSSMLEKDRSMAAADAQAAEASYKTVSGEISGGAYIYAPRAGSVSAIYKKVGDLVGPEMPIAVIAGNRTSDLIVRMHIPSNVRKPEVGTLVSVVRPGFSKDIRKARVVGIGSSLDATGSYMADAILQDRVDWPVEAAVRVIAPVDSGTRSVPLSSVWWDADGAPHVWRVSEAQRIFAQKVSLGRTLGQSIEIYEGLQKGDRYVIHPSPDMQEDMVLEDMPQESSDGGVSPKKSGGHDSMPGMDM